MTTSLLSVPRTLRLTLTAVATWCALAVPTVEPAAESAGVELSRSVTDLLATRPALRGRPVAAADLSGRPVVVSFFASWCPPCHTEFKHLAELHHQFAESGLSIIAINLFETFAGFDDGGARLELFLDRYDPAFFVIEGSDEIGKRFDGVERIPTVFVFDRRGKPVYRFIHLKGAKKTNPRYEELRAAVIEALAAPGG